MIAKLERRPGTTQWNMDPTQNMYESKDQESMQSSTTPDPGHHMGLWQKHKKYHTQESQEARPFLAGDHKAAMLQWTDKKAWRTRNINNKKDPQKEPAL